jgi:hypothetical protein
MTTSTPNGLHWIDALEARYPGFKIGYAECNSGWEALIARVLDVVSETVANPEDFTFAQIKEKYGFLDINYYLSEDVSDEARSRIEEVVDAVRDKSKTICEITGNPGQLIRRGTWVMTRCEELTQEGDVVLVPVVHH